jgi:hypothetical protein
MSRMILYGVPEEGEIKEIKEFNNSCTVLTNLI